MTYYCGVYLIFVGQVRVRLIHVALPMLASTMALILSILLLSLGVNSVPPGPPFNSMNTPSAGAYNVLMMIAVMIASTYMIYYLIRRGFMRLFEFIKITLLGTVVVSSTYFYVLVYTYGFGVAQVIGDLSLALPIALSIAIIYASLYSRSIPLRALGICSYSAMAGVIMMVALPAWTLGVLMAVLPIYDVIMVYRGFLGKLFSEARELGEARYSLLRGLILDMGGLGIGVGDLVIYSVLSSLTFAYYASRGLITALLAWSLCILGIMVGLGLTLRALLRGRKYVPALPLPIALGSLPLIYLLVSSLI